VTIMAKMAYDEIGKIRIGAKQGNCIGLWGVAVNPGTNRVYVTNVHTPNLAVFDGNSEEFVNVIRLTDKVEQMCVDICFNPVNERLYVTSHIFDRVWSVDANTEEVVGEYEPGSAPSGVASDYTTGKTYVALGGDPSVAVLDSNDKLLTKIPVKPWAYPVAVDPERRRAYTVSQMANLAVYQNFENPVGYPHGILNVIDTEKNEVIGEVGVERRSRGIAVDTKTGLVYVSNRVDDSVLVIDPENMKVIKRLKVHCNPMGLCMYPGKDKLYVVNLLGEWYDDIGQPAIVSVIDTRRNEVVKDIPVGKFSTSVAVNHANGRVYVSNEDDMDISIIDADKDEELCRVSARGTTVDGMEFISRTNRMYVPTHFVKGVRTVDTKKLEVVGDVIFDCWGVACAVNEKSDRIYFNNSQRGTVHVIDGRTNREVTWANLGVGSNMMRRLWAGIACDEKRDLVFAAMVRTNGVAVLRDEPEKARLLLLGRVSLGEPQLQDPGRFVGSTQMAVAANRETGNVYVYNTHRRLLSRLDPGEFKVTARLDLTGLRLPMADRGMSGFQRRFATHYVLAVDEKRDLVYASNFIVDGETMRIRGALPIEKVTGVQAVDNNKNRLYAHGIRGMSIMDPETYEELLFIPHGGNEAPDTELRVLWGVDSPNDRLYLQRHVMVEGNEIQVFDISEPRG